MKGFQQPEGRTQGVKRRRGKGSKREPPRKKLNCSPSPALEPSDRSTATSQDECQGTEEVVRNKTMESSSMSSNGLLTPVPNRKEKEVLTKPSRPAPATENSGSDSARRESGSSVFTKAGKSHSCKNLQSDYVCNVCGRRFGRGEHLKRHIDSPTVHLRKHKCVVCDDVFYHPTDLERHESNTGHKRRARYARGFFTEKEKGRLSQFKQRFCSEYGVSEFDFNTLMTLLGRRDGKEWPNPDVKKAELREMFYNVLPDRSTKSMNRYRERNFQNVEQDTEWTEEQIQELRDLVMEKGHRWVEIAELLGRTQDSVYQKWKNRIRQGDAQRFDHWEEDERAALISAVRECKLAAGLPTDFSSDDQVNWTSVSDRLGLRRNAQQCSTFWKRVYRPREEARARGENVKSLARRRSKTEPTTSRHQSRHRAMRDGKPVKIITPRRKIRGPMYITESDDNDVHNVSNPNARLKGKRASIAQNPSTASSRDHDLDQFTNGMQSAEEDRQEETHEDEEEKNGGNRGRTGSPTMIPQPNRLGSVVIPAPARLRHSQGSEPVRATGMNGSLPADVQSCEQHESSKHSKKTASSKRNSAALKSSFMEETAQLSPLSKRTPKHLTSLTQAFNDTQAPTSARTAEHAKSGKHLTEERPSPDIEVRPRPIRKDAHASIPESDNEDKSKEPGPAATPGADCAMYESESKISVNGRPSQLFSSAIPMQDVKVAAKSESRAQPGSKGRNRDDKGSPQILSSATVKDANQSAEAESDTESGSDDKFVQDDAGSEAEGTSEDEGTPLQMFSSAAPQVLNGMDGMDVPESGTEESDEEPPQMFSSATVPGQKEPQRSKMMSENDNDEDDEDDENDEEIAEGKGEQDEDEDEDEDEPPQIFASAVPDRKATPTSSLFRHPAIKPLQPTKTATSNDQPTSPSAEDSSSGDAATIPPYDSDRSESEAAASASAYHNNGDDAGESDQPQLGAPASDFFANLEASAKKVGWQRQTMQKRRTDANGRRKGKGKSVFDVSSSSDGEEEGKA